MIIIAVLVPPAPMAKTFQYTISVDSAEEAPFILHDEGALGTVVTDDSTVIAYFNEQSERSSSIEDICEKYGWSLVSSSLCEEKNWVQACEEVWRPIAVQGISIMPMLSVDAPVEELKNTILVIPGEGFGTGHHPSTRLALKLLQEAHQNGAKIESALDFGTGNGILALGSSLLWPAAQIVAIDYDESAIRNANEIVALNKKTDAIELRVCSLESVSGTFDLICANIYAEILVQYQQSIRAHLNPGGFAVLAGIMSSKRGMIEETFISPWHICSHLIEDDWDAYLLQLKG